MAKKKSAPTKVTNAQLQYQYNEMVLNEVMSRSQLLQRLMDPRRNIADECGYKQPSQITVEEFHDLYDEEPIASRVVHCLPEETWQITPEVYEDEDADVETDFEIAFKEVGRSLVGENTWHEDEESNPLWEYLLRIDVLSGIGFYGVLLLGTDDGAELSEPLQVKKGMRLTYMRPYPNLLAKVASLEADASNPRYGKPLVYTLQPFNPSDMTGDIVGGTLTTLTVHHSRVLHVADNLSSNEVYGIPRMRPVYRRLYDLVKLYGGSAEMYWKGAFPGLSFETHPQLGADVRVNPAKVREQMEQWQNGLQRWLALSGVTAKSMAPQVVDPASHIDKELEAICIRLGIPKRVFMGSERGELASSEDKDTWNDRKRFRRKRYVTPRIIIPLINWCIEYGILPPPEKFCVDWNDGDEPTEIEKAQILVHKTDALSKYVGGGVDSIVPPVEYLTKFMGMPDDEAEALVEAGDEYASDKQQLEQEQAMVDAEFEDEREIEKAKQLTTINPPQPPRNF